MAITIISEPINLESVFNDIQFVVFSNATADDLKVKAKLEYSRDNVNFTSLGLMYGEVDGANFNFNFSNRLQTVVTHDVYDITQNDLMANTPNSIVYYKITFIEQYANNIGLQEDFDTLISSTKQVVNTRIMRLDTFNLDSFILTSNTSKLLTDAPKQRIVQPNDLIQLSFLHSGEAILEPIILLNGNELNNVYIGTVELEHNRGVLLLKVADIIESDTRFFTLHIINNEDDTILSETLEFVIDTNCYSDTFQICWLNNRGGFDTYSFVGGKVETKDYSKETTTKYLSNSFTKADSDTQVVSSQTQMTITTYSLWETYEMRKWLSGLHASPVTFLINENGERIAIDIKNKSLTVKQDKKLLQVPVEFSFINEIIK